MSASSFKSTVTSRAAAAPAKTGGFWARFIAAFAKAREAQAKREVARYLAQRPDHYLRDIGMTEVEIAELRRQQQY